MGKFSKIGVVLSFIYLAVAIPLFYYSATCDTGFCQLIIIPVYYPAGLITSYSGGWFDSLSFIIPTVVVNAIFYYFVGAILGKIGKLF